MTFLPFLRAQNRYRPLSIGTNVIVVKLSNVFRLIDNSDFFNSSSYTTAYYAGQHWVATYFIGAFFSHYCSNIGPKPEPFQSWIRKDTIVMLMITVGSVMIGLFPTYWSLYFGFETPKVLELAYVTVTRLPYFIPYLTVLYVCYFKLCEY